LLTIFSAAFPFIFMVSSLKVLCGSLIAWTAFISSIAIIQAITGDDEDGSTALTWAVANSHEKISSLLLLDRDIDVDVRNDEGWTALIWAAAKGHDKMAAAFMDKGGNLDLQCNGGSSALMWAVRSLQI
jgi:Ankyrin repeats (3 copies)